jgi:dipeptidyl aminopeptidase/acylaminoacyl peptidase
LACPMIFFQGLEDPVVPPSQARMMVDAMRARGVPVAFLTFEGEQHGFRKSDSIVRCLEAELYFYSTVFGFVLPDPPSPIVIDNLDRWKTR